MRSCEHVASIKSVQRRTVQCAMHCASVLLSKGLRAFSSHSLAATGDWQMSFLI